MSQWRSGGAGELAIAAVDSSKTIAATTMRASTCCDDLRSLDTTFAGGEDIDRGFANLEEIWGKWPDRSRYYLAEIPASEYTAAAPSVMPRTNIIPAGAASTGVCPIRAMIFG